MKRPVYRLTIDFDDEGMDFNALVDYPAHGKSYVTMSKAPRKVELKYQFNEEKQIVTGVVIATDLLIFRRDPDGFEYDVYFSKDDALTIMKMFAKKGYHNNLNFMHNQETPVKDGYLIESYFINDKRSNIPEEFANQNLRAGSLIFSYWIEGAKTWEFVKENGAGFSLEGWFKEIEVKFVKQKKKQMSKDKKSLLERLGFKVEKAKFDKDNKDKYVTATTVDGVEVMYEILEVEQPIFLVSEEGEEVLAPAGDLSFEVDGVMMVVSVDEAGLITDIQPAEEMDDEDNTEEMEEAFNALKADYEKKFEAQSKTISDQTEQIKVMASAVDDLTQAVEKMSETKTPKRVAAGKVPAWREMKNKKKN